MNKVEILLVEDNPNDAKLTLRALKKNNLVNDIYHVKDGVEALNFIFAENEYAYRSIDNVPRVIFLDLKLPRINGLEVLEKIKSDPRTNKIPVVVLTSSAEDSDLKRCYRLGVNSYIVKPVDFEHFMDAVTKLGFYWLLLNQTPKK
ncbi:MAG: response regulator [Candidatus Cloacimonetes bacterium]|nr:response regulator [Candidatus Cloacimonadota bacterium]